jgi:RNA recognition motif-containing protein
LIIMKLFVGQIPKTMEEDAIRPIMEEFGVVKDIKVIRDKLTGAHRGTVSLLLHCKQFTYIHFRLLFCYI